MATFFNPKPVATDYFGDSVGLDAEKVIVGAPLKTSSVAEDGAIYVYTACSGLAELTNSDLYTVDINAQTNVSATYDYNEETIDESNPVILSLADGDYTVSVIGKDQGGEYDAWSRNGGKTEGCDDDGGNCEKGWEHEYSFAYGPNYKRVYSTGRYSATDLALQNTPAEQSFVLSVKTDVKFYVVDTGEAKNNSGGVSLKISRN